MYIISIQIFFTNINFHLSKYVHSVITHYQSILESAMQVSVSSVMWVLEMTVQYRV